jgi:hypothetical protein
MTEGAEHQDVVDRLAHRANTLLTLGFTYDSKLEAFTCCRSGKEPFILSKAFVRDVPNRTFFKEYYRLRKILRK